jgi:DNA polymerase theta
MLGEESRGYLLEVMLSKIRFLMSLQKPEVRIQMIAMSATLPNLKEIAMWLDSNLYVTKYRPVHVKEMLKIG